MLIYMVFIAVLGLPGIWAEFTTQDCRELGYIKSQLMCSSCNKLDDFGLETLKPHCLECCQKDHKPTATRRYPKAVLEVCTCKFRAYPQVEAFIKSGRPARFPNLTVKYMRGLDPVVKLQDKHGNVKETLSITKWNTDTIQEFFETHLLRPGSIESDESAEQVDKNGSKKAQQTTATPGESTPAEFDELDEELADFLFTNTI